MKSLPKIALFQLLLLFLMIGYSGLPVWFGKEIILDTEPLDPRDLLRGNYVELNYAISRLGKSLFSDSDWLKVTAGSTVYLALKRSDTEDVYLPQSASLTAGDYDLLLKGRVLYNLGESVHVHYGFERLYGTKEDSLNRESLARVTNMRAKIKILWGQGRIISLFKAE